MEKLLKKHAEKFRYLLVGGLNTLLDFVLLFAFVSLGIDKIVANYFSTGIAMVFSFFANKSFTFKDTHGSHKRQFVLFIVVTIIGIWVIQPLVIWGVTSLLEAHIANHLILLFFAKVIATCASLVWNYMLYSRLVFRKAHHENKKES